jgi:cysteine synthase A
MPRGRTYARITETMGDTPLIELRNLGRGLPGRIMVKHEGFNPYNSVKDRIGVAMVEDALESGGLREGMVVVEPTSGNTGIGVAFAATAYGFPCVFTMPDTMTLERRNLMKALGATLVLTPGDKGMKGAIQRAEEIAGRLGDRAWVPGQFHNPANPGVHYRTTGPEIWEDTGGQVDVFISGVGTGGTVTGAGRYLKERKPDLHVIAVEPTESPVLSGGEPGGHKQQGIGAGFIPEVLDTEIYDEVVQVSNEDAFDTALRLAREEAIFAGISSGSITWVALQVAARPESEGKLIVSIVCDFGERYLSNPLYADASEPGVPDDVRAAIAVGA